MSQEVSKRSVRGCFSPQDTPFTGRWKNPLIVTIDPKFRPGTSKQTILRGSGYLGYVDSNQGYKLYQSPQILGL